MSRSRKHDPCGADFAGEIYLEFRVEGRYVKVSAIDAATATEVAIVGPANGDERTLERAAIKKLRYVLSKKKPPPRRGFRPGHRV